MIPPGARTQISRSIMTVLLLWTGCPTHGAEPLPVTIIQRRMSLSSSPLGPLLLLLLGCATKCTATGWSGAAQWDFWTSGGCPGSAQATQTDSSKMSGAGLRTDDRRTCTRSSPDGGTTQYYYENIMFCFSDGSVMCITKNCGSTDDTCSDCPAETMRLYYSADEWAKHDTVGACIEATQRYVSYGAAPDYPLVLSPPDSWSYKLRSATPAFPAGLLKFVSPRCSPDPLPTTTATSTWTGPGDVRYYIGSTTCTGGAGVVEATQTITAVITLSSSTNAKDVTCLRYKLGGFNGTELYGRTETTCTGGAVAQDFFECTNSDCTVCQQTRADRLIIEGTYPPTTGGVCNTHTNADTGHIISFQYQNFDVDWADLFSQPSAVTSATCAATVDGGQAPSTTAALVSVLLSLM